MAPNAPDPSTSGPSSSATPPAPPHEAESAAEAALAELATDVKLPVAPVSSAVRADVSRFTAFLRSIHSGYLLAGLGLFVLTVTAAMIVIVTKSFSDWYMHLAMQVILFAFVMLYVRAHQLGRRVVRGVYAVLTLLLLAFYGWILVDLVPERLDVLSGRPRPDGLTGPEVVMRRAAPELYWVVAGFAAVFGWLALHWLFIGRYRSTDTHGRA